MSDQLNVMEILARHAAEQQKERRAELRKVFAKLKPTEKDVLRSFELCEADMEIKCGAVATVFWAAKEAIRTLESETDESKREIIEHQKAVTWSELQDYESDYAEKVKALEAELTARRQAATTASCNARVFSEKELALADLRKRFAGVLLPEGSFDGTFFGPGGLPPIVRTAVAAAGDDLPRELGIKPRQAAPAPAWQAPTYQPPKMELEK